MRPIPTKLREEMANDPFYKVCCYCASQPVEWHHVFIYAGKQINEKWAIVPACKKHHDLVQSDSNIRKFFELTSLSRATKEDFAKYPKRDWLSYKNRLYTSQVANDSVISNTIPI